MIGREWKGSGGAALVCIFACGCLQLAKRDAFPFPVLVRKVCDCGAFECFGLITGNRCVVLCCIVVWGRFGIRCGEDL